MSKNKITPNKDDIKIFMNVLFSLSDGYIALRSFAEKGGVKSRPPTHEWLDSDTYYVDKAYEFTKEVAKEGTGCYVIPGTVDERGRAKAADVIEMQTLLIDIDEGNTEEKLRILTAALDKPTLIVESGGITEEGHKKLHIYWQLLKPASGDDLKTLLNLRHKIALAVGGDVSFKSAHQPIRVAGSVYYKNGQCRLVKIRKYEPYEYHLSSLVRCAKSLPDAPVIEALNTDNKKSKTTSIQIPSLALHKPFEQVLTTKIHEGAVDGTTRFASLQRVIGYWLCRYHDRVINKEKALEEIAAYNEANVVPPWPDDKLQQMVNGLWKKHVDENGEGNAVNAAGDDIAAISPARWQGSPPEREWLIDGWLPRGYVTALYGDGGVGKSLLAQQLMTAVSLGRKFLGSEIKPCRVYAFMCEDDENELWRRQVDINKHYNIDMGELVNVRLVSRVGANNLLMTFNNSDAGQLTEFFFKLEQDIKAYNPDLVILDTAADIFGGNENNRPQVRQFIQSACAKIARATGGAVLLCAHPSESGMQKGTGSGGSTAWNNTVRSRWYLKRPDDGELTEDHRILLKVKSNYSKMGTQEYLKWEDGAFAILDSDDSSKPITGKKQNEKYTAERDRKTELILRLIDYEANEGRIYTMNQFAQKFEDSKSMSYGLGSRRSINERLSIAATHGLVLFFNPNKYGLDIKKFSHGYICGENTMLKTMRVDSENGEITTELIKIEPTHYKCESNGQILSIDKQKIEEKNYE